ncbi:MAG: FAD:protein FMN transferase [Pirellulales bacterium]|nr:FAD:protein FMN transferase [Pirellulales bacterium]
MGTTYTVKVVPAPGAKSTVDKLLNEGIDCVLKDVDRAMSTYRDDSELSRFNASESTDWFNVSPETARVVAEALRVGRLAGGAYDVTVEPLVRLWNFGAHPLPSDAVPSDEQIEEMRKSVGLDHLAVRLDPPALKKDLPGLHVDLSSIAKGFAVDRAAELLDAEGCENYMVEVGGEVRARGCNASGRPWQIAVERPTDGPREIQRVVPLVDRAMATSGDYRNYFERDGRRYSHLIDPRVGRPIAHRLASVTVLADRCMEADAWATALSILGPEAGMRLADDRGIAASFLIRQGDVFVERRSAAFPTPE